MYRATVGRHPPVNMLRSSARKGDAKRVASRYVGNDFNAVFEKGHRMRERARERKGPAV